jgi:hypothetical protein
MSRPPLDTWTALRLLVVGAPLVPIVLGFGPRKTFDFVLVSTFLGIVVAFLYGPLAQRATGAIRRAVYALQVFLVLSPICVAGAYQGDMTPTLVTNAVILVAAGAGLETLRRRSSELV